MRRSSPTPGPSPGSPRPRAGPAVALMPTSAPRCPIESLSAPDGPSAARPPLPGAFVPRGCAPCPGPAHSPGRAQPGRAGPAEGPLPPHAARSRPRGPRGGPAEPAAPSMATRPPCLWLCLAGLLSLRAASALPLRPEPWDEVLAAALQRLREVFDIEELPPDVLPRKKPPQFMVDLFNKVADSNGITRAPGLLQGDVVRSFEDRGGPGAAGTGPRSIPAAGAGPAVLPKEGSFPVHMDHHHFYFDISAMEKGEQMLKAEFRVFKLKRTHRSRRSDVQHFCKVSGEIGKHLILLSLLLILKIRSATTYHANLLYCYFCFVILTFSLPPACKEVM